MRVRDGGTQVASSVALPNFGGRPWFSRTTTRLRLKLDFQRYSPCFTTVYMAACGGTSCTGFNSDSAQWFKIDQASIDKCCNITHHY